MRGAARRLWSYYGEVRAVGHVTCAALVERRTLRMRDHSLQAGGEAERDVESVGSSNALPRQEARRFLKIREGAAASGTPGV